MVNLEDSVAIDFIVWLLICLIIIGIIIAIWGNIRLYQHREELFMEKREPSIQFGLNTSIILGMIASIGIIYSKYKQNTTSYIVFIALYFASWFLIFLFLNTKNFVIHFRYKWQYFTLQSKWQQIINPNIINELHENNWYIRNNHKWNKLCNIYIGFGIMHIINFIFCVVLSSVRPQISNKIIFVFFDIIYVLQFTFPFIIYMIIEVKTPHFDDTLYIHWESRMEAKLTVILIILFLSGNLTMSINGEFTLKDALILSSIRALTLFGLVFVSTFMITHKNKGKKQSSIQRVCTESPVPTFSDIRITLDNVLANPSAINLFMNHLSREYSMECLLSYIEFDQYQKHIIKTTNNYLQEHASEPLKDNLMPTITEYESMANIETMNTLRNVPKSIIIEAQSSIRSTDIGDVDDKILHDVKKKARLLYLKYIKVGCEFEINVSHQMRKHLMDILEDKHELMDGDKGKALKVRDLLMIYEEPKEEMKMLLQYSFTRLKSTKQYVKMVHILNGKESPI